MHGVLREAAADDARGGFAFALTPLGLRLRAMLADRMVDLFSFSPAYLTAWANPTPYMRGERWGEVGRDGERWL